MIFPWATAFLVDVAALQLCAAATRAPERHEGLGDALRALLRLRAASYSAENFDELRHRRELAMLFLVRPASLATLRSLWLGSLAELSLALLVEPPPQVCLHRAGWGEDRAGFVALGRPSV